MSIARFVLFDAPICKACPVELGDTSVVSVSLSNGDVTVPVKVGLDVSATVPVASGSVIVLAPVGVVGAF